MTCRRRKTLPTSPRSTNPTPSTTRDLLNVAHAVGRHTATGNEGAVSAEFLGRAEGSKMQMCLSLSRPKDPVSPKSQSRLFSFFFFFLLLHL